MNESVPNISKTKEQLLNEIDQINIMVEGLVYILLSNDYDLEDNVVEELETLLASHRDIARQLKSGKISLGVVLKNSMKIFKEIKDIALSAKISPKQISLENLRPYGEMSIFDANNPKKVN